jgi:hypothetical protein
VINSCCYCFRDYVPSVAACNCLATTAIAELRTEVSRLKECAAAQPLEDGRSCRVSMELTAEKRPCLIVTAPAHWDEAKLGDTIAGVLNLWTATADALAAQKRSTKMCAACLGDGPGSSCTTCGGTGRVPDSLTGEAP